MWSFRGGYTGEAKAYIREKQKREKVLYAVLILTLALVESLLVAFMLGAGDTTLWLVLFFGGFVGMLAIGGLILFLAYRKEPKCAININNDGFEVYADGKWCPLAFYKIKEIIEYDDFIAVENLSRFKVALQKDLLVKGDWEELKALLKKVEDSLETDDPMYQIDAPSTEYFDAVVKSKRIYEKFVNGVSWTTPVGVFQYFATFELENGEEIEYEIGQETYEKIENAQTGLLVIINGNFFAFGEGEEMDEND